MPADPPDSAASVDRAAVLASATTLLAAADVATAPTPVEALLAVHDLRTEQFAFSDPLSDRGLPVPLARAQADLRPQVRGMVDVPERVIYTHRGLGDTQRRFVTLHELGHFVLPWHATLLQTCSEQDLSPVARRAWEREANLFAGACLFQGAAFTAAARGGRFGWATVRRLAARYAASLEATARQFVISRPEPALLLVATLRPALAQARSAASGEPLLEVRYAAGSPAWYRSAGREALPAPGTPLPWPHPATRVLLATRPGTLGAALAGPLDDGAGPPLAAELLSNGHDVLLLGQLAEGGVTSPKGAG